MELKMDERANLREISDEYKKTQLAENNNEYFTEKPYYLEYFGANQRAKYAAILGHSLSVLIGCFCGHHLGIALFAGFDYEIYSGVSLGSIFGILLVVLVASIWELIKHSYLHSFFKNWYWFQRRYTTAKSWAKLAVLFGGSMVLSGLGGFEVVSRWFGNHKTSETTMVNVTEKTAHIQKAIDDKLGQIAALEEGQQYYVEQGKARRIKVDQEIGRMNLSLDTLNASLIAAVAHWENHNARSKGATKKSNELQKAEHEGEKLWYALLFALCAMLADGVTLYCIRYNERYKFSSHIEMIGIDRFLTNLENQSKGMQVVHKSSRLVNKTTENQQKTSPKPKSGLSKLPKPVKNHGVCFWEEGKALMWFKRESDGLLVAKNVSSLKGMRNKAKGRAEKARSKEARENNLEKEKYYDELYQKLWAFQNKEVG